MSEARRKKMNKETNVQVSDTRMLNSIPNARQQKTNSPYARYSFSIFQLRLSYRRAGRFQNAWACGWWGV